MRYHRGPPSGAADIAEGLHPLPTLLPLFQEIHFLVQGGNWEQIYSIHFASGFKKEVSNRKGISQQLMHVCIFAQQPCTLNIKKTNTVRTREDSNIGRTLPHMPEFEGACTSNFQTARDQIQPSQQRRQGTDVDSPGHPNVQQVLFSKKGCQSPDAKEERLPSLVPGFFASSGNESTSSSLVEFA